MVTAFRPAQGKHRRNHHHHGATAVDQHTILLQFPMQLSFLLVSCFTDDGNFHVGIAA